MKAIEEFIALCQRVTEDGHLTDQEVFELHGWIEGHPELHDEWPVSKLAFHVSRAVADGQVNEEELTAIGPALIEIETRWSTRQSQLIAQQAADNFDLASASLPVLAVSLNIESSREADSYQVDLSECRCNCPDWQGQRQRFPLGHIGRCCKHVAEALTRLRPESDWPGWLAALIDDCVSRDRGVSPREDWRVIQIQNDECLVSTANHGWSNVYAPIAKRAYGRFGYSLIERRWSYGIVPPAALTIAAALHLWLDNK